jgi:hypothetical protein
MMPMVSHLEELITQLRPTLPKNTALAQAIDEHAPWEQIARKAIDDGYIEIADEFVQFVEACARHSTP